MPGAQSLLFRLSPSPGPTSPGDVFWVLSFAHRRAGSPCPQWTPLLVLSLHLHVELMHTKPRTRQPGFLLPQGLCIPVLCGPLIL